MPQIRRVIVCAAAGAALVGSGCASTSPSAAPPADDLTRARETAAARAQATQHVTPAMKAMRRTLAYVVSHRSN